MREIKFRGIEKKTKKWVYGTLFAGQIYEQPEFGTGRGYHDFGKEVIEETVGIFLEPKDINGTDIYEGDIMTNGERNYEVKSIESSFFIVNCHGTAAYRLCKSEIAEYGFRVIGNIHQNKELLK